MLGSSAHNTYTQNWLFLYIAPTMKDEIPFRFGGKGKSYQPSVTDVKRDLFNFRRN